MKGDYELFISSSYFGAKLTFAHMINDHVSWWFWWPYIGYWIWHNICCGIWALKMPRKKRNIKIFCFWKYGYSVTSLLLKYTVRKLLGGYLGWGGGQTRYFWMMQSSERKNTTKTNFTCRSDPMSFDLLVKRWVMTGGCRSVSGGCHRWNPWYFAKNLGGLNVSKIKMSPSYGRFDLLGSLGRVFRAEF